MNIPDEAVEAAAKVLAGVEDWPAQWVDEYIDQYRQLTARALAAATPIIVASAAIEARDNNSHIVEGDSGYSAGFHYALQCIHAQGWRPDADNKVIPVVTHEMAEARKALFATLAEEASADRRATQWGTDCWGFVQSEPSEEHARKVAAHTKADLYSRPPMGAWTKEDQ